MPMMAPFRHTIIMLAMLMLAVGKTTAQENRAAIYQFDFEQVFLSEALEQIASSAQLDIVYEPSLIHQLKITKKVEARSLPELLQKILEGTGLNIQQLSTGTYIIVAADGESSAEGSYAGRIIDAISGTPLPSATVIKEETFWGTSTNREGYFELSPLEAGTYQLIFSYVGYEPVSKTVHIEPGQTLQHTIELKPKPVDFSPIVVTAHKLRLPRNSGPDLTIKPGNFEPNSSLGIVDALNSLGFVSGVQYGLPTSDLHVQGGHSGEHRLQLDGVPIYNPHSFGRMFSAFSPYAIGQIELYKAGYGVQQGSQISGIINLNHDLSSNTHQYGLVQGDPLSLNSRVDLDMTTEGNTRIQLMGSFRSNYWNIYQYSPLESTLKQWDEVDPLILGLFLDSDFDITGYQTLNHDSNVRFRDIHLASRIELDNYHQLSTSFYSGRNFISTDLVNQLNRENSGFYSFAMDRYQWNNTMGQLTHDWAVSPQLALSSQISFSSNSLDHDYKFTNSREPIFRQYDANNYEYFVDEVQNLYKYNLLPTHDDLNRIRHYIFRTDANYSASANLQLNSGMQIDRIGTSIQVTDLFRAQSRMNKESTRAGVYLNGEWRPSDSWSYRLGSRLTWTSDSRNLYPEPRASIQYNRAESSLGYWSLMVSGGLYRQFVNQFEITNVGPTTLVPSFTTWLHAGPGHTPSKAWHISASLLYEPVPTTSISVELFRKWQPVTWITSYQGATTLLIPIPDNQFDIFAEKSSMDAYGLSSRFSQLLPSADLKIELGYDFSFSQIDMESQFGRTVQAPWNEPHRFSASTLWRPDGRFSLIARWQSIFGRTWGYRRAYYDFLKFYSDLQIFDSPETDRLSDFHQLDFSFVYSPAARLANFEFRVDLINVTSRRNVIDWSLVPTTDESDLTIYERRKRTLPGFTPSVSIEFRF